MATAGADVKNGVLLAVDIINNDHKIDLPLARSKGDKTFVQSFYLFLQDIREEKGIKVEKLGIVHENAVWGSEFR